jgi:transcriptional regulator with XRE-family HTH domain
MGSSRRIRPAKLAGKLKRIRLDLNLTIDELIRKLDCSEVPLYRSTISQYEKNLREPPLIVLLNYGRIAKLPLEVLIDDNINFPYND